MKVIPAIDIRGGRVVRLAQGLADKETIYPDSPLEVAERWASFGAETIHIVDLDGAMCGRLKNLAIAERIAKKISAKIEFGGGIRDEAAVKLVLDSGIDKAVIGTKALDEKFLKAIAKKFKERIVIAVDARGGVVYTKGWLAKTEVTVTDLVEEVRDAGVKTINYTDIAKDGMLEGPNFGNLKALLKVAGLDVIAAGGISSIADVLSLNSLGAEGLKGMIIGKALYEGKVDLGEAIKICAEE